MRYFSLAITNLPKANSRYLAGMSIINARTIRAWFQRRPTDTSALSLSLVHDAMIKSILGGDHSIQVINSPVPPRNDKEGKRTGKFDNPNKSLLVLIITIGMSFVSSFYIMFHIKERISKAKLMQMVSGLNICTFWLVSFLFDFVTYMLTVFIVIITLTILGEKGWSSASDVSSVTTVLITFGLSFLPMMYVLSFVFSTPTAGSIWMIVISILMGKREFLFTNEFYEYSKEKLTICFSYRIYI